MQLKVFLDRLEAIRLRQLEISINNKPNPRVYEELLQRPLMQVIDMFNKVDEIILNEQTDTLIKKLREDIKKGTSNKY